MKLVFVSNFFNHHQKGISDYFYKNTDRYRFVSTTSIPDERKKLGYEDYLELLQSLDNWKEYEGLSPRKQFEKLAEECGAESYEEKVSGVC